MITNKRKLTSPPCHSMKENENLRELVNEVSVNNMSLPIEWTRDLFIPAGVMTREGPWEAGEAGTHVMGVW